MLSLTYRHYTVQSVGELKGVGQLSVGDYYFERLVEVVDLRMASEEDQ